MVTETYERNIWKKHFLSIGQYFGNDLLPSGINVFHETSWYESCNGQMDNDPVMNNACWDASCPCISEKVKGEATHTTTPPQLLQFQVLHLPDQEVICAKQQICFCNLSYMLTFSAQELSAQVRISTGNGCILHTSKQNRVLAVLPLYVTRGDQAGGGRCSGEEEVGDHFYCAFESRLEAGQHAK